MIFKSMVSIKPFLKRTVRSVSKIYPFSRISNWLATEEFNAFFRGSWLGFFLEKHDIIIGVFNAKRNQLWERMVRGEFEPEWTEVIKRLIPLADGFVDAGAHIGWYTCIAARNLNQGRVTSFEPNKTNYLSLKTTIKANRFNNVTIHNLGLSDKLGRVQLYGDDSAGSIVESGFLTKPEDVQEISLERLDSFVQEVGRVGSLFLKIDVEASEYQLLMGAKEFFNKIKPAFIMIEIVKNWSGGANPDFNQTFRFFQERKYQCFCLSNDSDLIREIEYNNLHTEKDHGGYLFVTPELVSQALRVLRE